jgi:hypothetical protein
MSSYKPEYCKKLKEHCENGNSLESFCAKINVSPKAITEWYEMHEDFQHMLEMAPCLELYYWEQALLTAMHQKNKEGMLISKSRIDALSKYVTSPLKKETYTGLKEHKKTQTFGNSKDALNDYFLLQNHKKIELED